jgi:DNA-directed RNA polymerase subunit M/transcription elongation factor TFIIS
MNKPKTGIARANLNEWDKQTMKLLKQLRVDGEGHNPSFGPMPKQVMKSFVQFSARLLSDVLQAHAFMDEFFGSLFITLTTWDQVIAYLDRPTFCDSLAACAQGESTPYLPCFDHLKEFVKPPSSALLNDQTLERQMEEEEQDSVASQKQYKEITGAELSNLLQKVCCGVCQGTMGTVLSLQTRSADEGSSMKFVCGKKDCGVSTEIGEV